MPFPPNLKKPGAAPKDESDSESESESESESTAPDAKGAKKNPLQMWAESKKK